MGIAAAIDDRRSCFEAGGRGRLRGEASRQPGLIGQSRAVCGGEPAAASTGQRTSPARAWRSDWCRWHRTARCRSARKPEAQIVLGQQDPARFLQCLGILCANQVVDGWKVTGRHPAAREVDHLFQDTALCQTRQGSGPRRRSWVTMVGRTGLSFGIQEHGAVVKATDADRGHRRSADPGPPPGPARPPHSILPTTFWDPVPPTPSDRPRYGFAALPSPRSVPSRSKTAALRPLVPRSIPSRCSHRSLRCADRRLDQSRQEDWSSPCTLSQSSRT